MHAYSAHFIINKESLLIYFGLQKTQVTYDPMRRHALVDFYRNRTLEMVTLLENVMGVFLVTIAHGGCWDTQHTASAVRL